MVQINGIPRVLPTFTVCDLGTDMDLFVTTPQSVANSTWRFTGWSDLGPNPRTIRCDIPLNYTANFERVDVTPPTTPSPAQPVVAFVILAIVVIAVVLLGILLWWTTRKESPTAPPPVPLQLGHPAASASRCPNCGSPREQDWTYCMMCGAPLR